ncbi:MAG: RraA family protein [Treponema sp.]|jgi:regulator of RNase E activity RraA|nr:RraA family protein [Treponema sp.]
MELTEEILARLRKVDPATIGHFISGGFMAPKMKPINRQSKLAGPACTVRLIGKDSTPLYYAIKHGKPGSVLVIDRCGDDTYACVGEMVAFCAEIRGFAGIVIDGPATDSLALERSGFPVFCTGISVVTTNVFGLTGDYDKPVNCAGAVVHPGDIVLGDADGVVVLSPEELPAALERAEAALAREATAKARLTEAGYFNINIDKLWETDVMALINSAKE